MLYASISIALSLSFSFSLSHNAKHHPFFGTCLVVATEQALCSTTHREPQMNANC